MKKILPVLFLALTFASCSLDEKIESSSVKEKYYQTSAQCLTGLNGCYIPLRNIYGNISYFVVTECQADMIYYNGADVMDAILEVSQSKPQFGTTMWTQGYIGVSRCNAMEAAIKNAPISDEEKAPLMAEMTILRAFYYYILTANFGDVPFYEEEVTNDNNEAIATLPRYSAKKIREKMVEELREWILDKKALSFTRTYDVNANSEYRMGAAVGLMLGGRMSLWDGRWNEAVEFFSKLEEIYGDLMAYPISDIKFRNKYTRESIFEIAYTVDDYKLQVYHALSSRCLPKREKYASADPDEELDIRSQDDEVDYYAGIGIPELGRYCTTRSPFRPTNKIYNADHLPYAGNDKRTCSSKAGGEVEDGGGWLAWGWTGYTPEDDRKVDEPRWRFFSGLSQTSRPYLGDKFWCFGMRYTYDSNNIKVFRYAGAILGLAEAWRELGDLDKSLQYLNLVRRRAGAAEYLGSFTADRLRQLIMDEYGIELFGEYCRKHDLVRWDVWLDVVSENTNATRLNQNKKPCHRYYPIPSEQITYSRGALNNKEYEEYGL